MQACKDMGTVRFGMYQVTRSGYVYKHDGNGAIRRVHGEEAQRVKRELAAYLRAEAHRLREKEKDAMCPEGKPAPLKETLIFLLCLIIGSSVMTTLIVVALKRLINH